MLRPPTNAGREARGPSGEAITTVIEGYEAWHAAEPMVGHQDSAQTWRQR